jgi:hypothetical protein
VSPDQRRVNITGGTFQGSAIGIGHVEQHGATFGPDARLADLRAMVTDASDDIVAAGADDEERSDLRHELRKIERELATENPDGSAVRARWNSVLAVLDGALAAGSKIAGITELVHQLFGG